MSNAADGGKPIGSPQADSPKLGEIVRLPVRPRIIEIGYVSFADLCLGDNKPADRAESRDIPAWIGWAILLLGYAALGACFVEFGIVPVHHFGE